MEVEYMRIVSMVALAMSLPRTWHTASGKAVRRWIIRLNLGAWEIELAVVNGNGLPECNANGTPLLGWIHRKSLFQKGTGEREAKHESS